MGQSAIVLIQLNRGEHRHALARRIFFGNQGVFRTGGYEEMMNKASALSLLSNAVPPPQKKRRKRRKKTVETVVEKQRPVRIN